MALSDLQVFSENFYKASGEFLAEQIDLFNGATENCLVLSNAFHQGPYSDEVTFAFVADLIRRRNPAATTSISSATPAHELKTSVKVAGGTKEIRFQPSTFLWIKQNPQLAALNMAQQVAEQMLKDMLDVALGSFHAAVSNNADTLNSIVGVAADTDANKVITWRTLNDTAFKFGDAAQDIRCWVMHSRLAASLLDQNLQNSANLFSWGTVNVVRDPIGRRIVISDNARLIEAAATSTYIMNVLGLTPGAVTISQNNDYLANEQTINGFENIIHSFQAEWSYNAEVKGFAWDKGNGGTAPSNAALFTGSNWDRYVTSHKNSAGVVCEGFATLADATAQT